MAPSGDLGPFFEVHRDANAALDDLLGHASFRAGVVVASLLYLTWLLLLLWTARERQNAIKYNQAVTNEAKEAEQDLQEERARSYRDWEHIQGEKHRRDVEQIRTRYEQTQSEIEDYFNKLVAGGDEEYQRRLAEIKAQYQHELADITRRYGSQ